MNKCLGGVSALAIAALNFGSSSVLAQTISGEDASESFSLETILVTARNRAEDIQDVPLDITAITAEGLQTKSIDTLEDVARFTPGLTFETLDGANGAPTIRGISQIATVNREQTTAVFYDNIYLPRSYLFDATTEGLARIEVVKGPQSSRFGRNAFAGAINYIPQKASLDDFSAQGYATFGSDERFDIGGNINAVVLPDQLAVFGAYQHTEFDGSWENRHPFADFGFSPGTNGNAGGRNNETYTIGAIAKPIPDLTIQASYFNAEIRNEANPTRYQKVNGPEGIGNFGTPGSDGFERIFFGEVDEPEDDVAVEPRGYARQTDSEIIRVEVGYDFADDWNFTYLFGNIKANSTTAFQSETDPVGCGTLFNPAIFGPTPLCNFQASPLGSLDYSSHEARVSYENDRFRAGFGAFYLNGDEENFFVSATVPSLTVLELQEFQPLRLLPVQSTFDTSNGLDPARFRNLLVRLEQTTTETVALFGEATVSFNDGRTRVSAEGRYTWEEIDTFDLRRDIPVGTSPETFKFFTPRFTVEHDFTSDSLVYVSAARGAKAGGFNAGAFDPDVIGSFEPEFNWTYEIGTKNTLFDDRLTLNAAAFYTDWTNQQLRVRDPSNPNTGLGALTAAVTTNVGNATVYGVEASAVFQVYDAFSVDGNMAYIRSKFSDGAFDPLAGEQGQDPDIGGNFLPRSPEFTMALGGQYQEQIINDDTTLLIRLDGTYQTKQFVDPINNVILPGRFLANGRVGVDYKNYSLHFWMRNILDKKFVTSVNLLYQRPPGNNFLGSLYGQRRTFGLTARANF